MALVQTSFNLGCMSFLKEHLPNDWPIAFAAHELAPEIFEAAKGRTLQVAVKSPFVKHLLQSADMFFARVLQMRGTGIAPDLSSIVLNAASFPPSSHEMRGRMLTHRRAVSILLKALDTPKILSFSLIPSVLLFQLYIAKKINADVQPYIHSVSALSLIGVPNIPQNISAILEDTFKFDSVAFLNELSEEKSAANLGIPPMDVSKMLHFDMTLGNVRSHPEEFEGIFAKLLFSPSLRKSLMEKDVGRLTTIVQLFGKQFA
jgi:hypothetical protein